MNATDKKDKNNIEHPDIIIEGGVLLTMVDGEAPKDNARVFITKDRISDINPSGYPCAEDAEVIDARNANLRTCFHLIIR